MWCTCVCLLCGCIWNSGVRGGIQGVVTHATHTQDGGRLVPVLLQPPSEVPWCPICIDPAPEDADAARAAHPLFFDDSLPAPLRVARGE